MQSQEIPNKQWGSFLDTITRKHEGETICLELHKADAPNETSDVRLIGINFNHKQRLATEIGVTIRDGANAHLMHAIVHPSHLRAARGEDGTDISLQIESADGLITLVRFNFPHKDQSASR